MDTAIANKNYGPVHLPEKTLLTPEEFQSFASVFQDVVEAVLSDPELADHPVENLEYLKQILHYNVPGGKLLRGCLVVSTFHHFVPFPTPEELHLAYVLGWVVELFQGWAIILDDIVDRSEFRRGKLCWYKQPKVGEIAAVDSNIVLAAGFKVLEHFFQTKPCYNQLVKIYQDVLWWIILGEGLDTKVPTMYKLDEYTDEIHKAAVKGKTSVYTFYFPVAMATAMAGKLTPDMEGLIKKMALEIGYFYNVQDDFMDIFVDSKETLKVGTDIQEGKCTWIMITAMKEATLSQRQILMENFAKPDPENAATVKRCLMEIGIPEMYAQFEQETSHRIRKLICQLPSDAPAGVYQQVMELLFARRR